MWIICSFCLSCLFLVDIKCSATMSLRCIVQYTGDCEQPCYSIVSKNVKVAELERYRLPIQRTDDFRTEPYNLNYYNITVPLNVSRMEKFDIIENFGMIRQLWAKNKLQKTTLWEVEPVSSTQKGCDKPVLNLVISITPTESNNNDVTVIHVYDAIGVMPIGPKSEGETGSEILVPSPSLVCEELKSECDSLHNETKLDFKKISSGEKEQIELRIWNTDIRKPFIVELLTSSCNITCENGTTFCSNVDVDVQNFTWYPYESKYINATKPGYYCARLFPDHMCCGISTISIEIIPSNLTMNVTYTPLPILIDTDIIPNEFYITGIFIITLLAMVTIIILSIFIRGKHNKYCSYYGITSNEPVDDNLLCTDLSESTSPPSSPNNQKIEVLLLYQKGSDEFLLLMKTLRTIISSYFSQVWDPFSQHLIEEVSANPIEWIDKLLYSSHIKVIIATDEGFKSDQVKDHYLNQLFKYAVTAIQKNPLLTHNYQRLFIIRFNSHTTNKEFINIVPCTRYKIPDHLFLLMYDLAGVKPEHLVNGRREPQLFWNQLNELDSVLQNYHNKLSNAIL